MELILMVEKSTLVLFRVPFGAGADICLAIKSKMRF